MTLATSLATIIGLLSNFKAERSGTDMNEFMGWLREKNKADVAAAIERNDTLAAQLSSVLSANQEDLVARLASLNDALAQIAANISGFGRLAEELHHTPVMSKQAMSILRQLVASKASCVMELKRFPAHTLC
jgi:ABC-type transporter Mla subunit MlaD